MEEKKARNLSKSEIGLVIRGYGSIFSDFDPRPYSARALSDDFIHEARKASEDKENRDIKIRFILPGKNRNIKEEETIKGRLKNHFERHREIARKKYLQVIKKGLSFVLSGIIIMLLASWIMFSVSSKSFLINFMIIILEPAGWFLFWEGLNLIVFRSKEIKPDFEFYSKMSNAGISFQSR